jgi:SAM-dependent methyltransferase
MSNQEQIDYWNGDAGRKWAQRDSQMARLLAPVSEALLDHSDLAGTRAALDVGCGGGSGTRLLAERLAPEACILGVDISEPLLDIAREGGSESQGHIAYLCADAASHDFGEPQFDLLFSRFGVMFFDDPTAAFTHMRAAMLPGAKLAFCCWQALATNAWTALPLQAALTVLPRPPAPPPRAPGPFAFAEPAYVQEVLSGAGWADIQVTPREIELAWPGDTGLETAVRELVNTGPVSRLLIEASEAERQAVYDAATQALEDHFVDGALRLTGAIWLVTARN